MTVDRASTLIEALATYYPDSSRTTIRQMLQMGRVRVNAEVEKNAKCELALGDIVEVGQKEMQATLPAGLSLLHEDDDVIVVIKAAGLLTVATEREKETTAQSFLNQYLEIKRQGRIHVVHRLDRETSGVLVFAKSFSAREALKEQFAVHSVERLYLAVIEGAIQPPSGTIRTWLRERRDLRMESVDAHPDAKLAVTHYLTVDRSDGFSLLEVTLETGRKNQIRTHLSEKGHPVAGDRMYGSETNPLGRLGLHAKLLGFNHPASGEKLVFTAPVPTVFRELFRKGPKG
ncbi:MAG TPA: RluA family pseudouridine synthase [Thermoanaerobaculia bacterium]